MKTLTFRMGNPHRSTVNMLMLAESGKKQVNVAQMTEVTSRLAVALSLASADEALIWLLGMRKVGRDNIGRVARKHNKKQKKART